MGKQNLINFYDAAGFGVFGVPLPTFSAWIGGVEMLLGVLCLGAHFSAFFLAASSLFFRGIAACRGSSYQASF
jgi:hypothetical protein